MSELALANSYADSSQESFGRFSIVLSLFRNPCESDKTASDIFDAVPPLLRKAGKKYPLWNVQVDEVPLSADLRYEGGYWFAELEWLNVQSEGSSIRDAIQNLERHIDHFLDYYANLNRDALTKYALELQKRFARVKRT